MTFVLCSSICAFCEFTYKYVASAFTVEITSHAVCTVSFKLFSVQHSNGVGGISPISKNF